MKLKNSREIHSKTNSAERLIDLMNEAADRLSPRQIKIMEVCGTHTAVACQSGLHSLLPDNVRLISGPGCPVCVTPAGYIEQAVKLALERDVHITTYGDMIRVPGISMSLGEARSAGADVSVVYSVQDALDIARNRPGQQAMFLGIGFETTAPAGAVAVKTARQEGIGNFLFFSAHKVIIPAMKALLEDPQLSIDGFIAPGHVSVIIGVDVYSIVTERYGKPCVAAGFDAEQMLKALLTILLQLLRKEPKVENVYGSRVKKAGNIEALQILDEVYETADSRWRGMGTIPKSGLELKDEFAAFDVRKVFELEEPQDVEPSGCLCSNVIKGVNLPDECPLFANRCTPSAPIGACMVSREGSCNVYYQYRK